MPNCSRAKFLLNFTTDERKLKLLSITERVYIWRKNKDEYENGSIDKTEYKKIMNQYDAMLAKTKKQKMKLFKQSYDSLYTSDDDLKYIYIAVRPSYGSSIEQISKISEVKVGMSQSQKGDRSTQTRTDSPDHMCISYFFAPVRLIRDLDNDLRSILGESFNVVPHPSGARSEYFRGDPNAILSFLEEYYTEWMLEANGEATHNGKVKGIYDAILIASKPKYIKRLPVFNQGDVEKGMALTLGLVHCLKEYYGKRKL